MRNLIIEKYKWEPNFPNETWITSKDSRDEFIITLKKGEDIEIEFNWDYGYGGRGSSHLYIPFKQLRDLINELYDGENCTISDEQLNRLLDKSRKEFVEMLHVKLTQKEKLQIQIDLLNEIITNNSDNYIVNKLRDLELELSKL